MTEPEAPAAEPTESTEPKSQGRPRPEETKARDQQVLELVAGAGTAGISRQGIAAALGEGIKSSHAYLSLFRLHRDGLVDRVRVAGKHVWVTTENKPAEAPAEPAPVA